MSVLSRLEEERHYIIRQDEIVDRLHRVEPIMPLLTNQELTADNYSGVENHILISCNLIGNFSRQSFKSNIFMDCILSGDFTGCQFDESDLVDCQMKGDFTNSAFTGSYIRRSDIINAGFNHAIPRQMTSEQAAKIDNRKRTGVVIFCAQVEKSMYQAEDVAIFMPVTVRLPEMPLMPFLARLYFDGTRKKLGFISLEDFLLPPGSVKNERIWSQFIYTLPREQTVLREIIIQNMLAGSEKDNQGFKIINPLEIEAENLALRPARPLNIQELNANKEIMNSAIRKSLKI